MRPEVDIVSTKVIQVKTINISNKSKPKDPKKEYKFN